MVIISYSASRGSSSRSCWVAVPSQAATFFCPRRHLRRAATAQALRHAHQPLVAPGLNPGVDGGVAHGVKRSELGQRLAPMMPWPGLGPAALAGMGRVQGTRFQRLDFFGLKRKRGKLHTPK